jgi:hypothetical protein
MKRDWPVSRSDCFIPVRGCVGAKQPALPTVPFHSTQRAVTEPNTLSNLVKISPDARESCRAAAVQLQSRWPTRSGTHAHRVAVLAPSLALPYLMRRRCFWGGEYAEPRLKQNGVEGRL